MVNGKNRTLFTSLEECCTTPLAEQKKHVVKLLELIDIEKHLQKNKQYTVRPTVERKAIARCYGAKAMFCYPYARNLIHELQARPNLYCRFVCRSAYEINRVLIAHDLVLINRERTFARGSATYDTSLEI